MASQGHAARPPAPRPGVQPNALVNQQGRGDTLAGARGTGQGASLQRLAQASGSRAASAASWADGTGAATSSKVWPLRQYRLTIPSRAVHAVRCPVRPWARTGMENGHRVATAD